MPPQFLPGTNIEIDGRSGQDYRLIFQATFAVTGGIYLSQLSDIVGVPGASLQNWVKREFVSGPVNKRYTRRQTCRIILIAILRHVLPLEDIAVLLSSINNDLADEADDLIDDSDLYLYFCDIVLNLEPADYFRHDVLKARISEVTGDFQGGTPDERQQLHEVLLIMVLAYGATLLQSEACGRLKVNKGAGKKNADPSRSGKEEKNADMVE